ncbi:hypothetical protein AAGS61_20440 [Lysinibacillus sp. KU-BSD001]|uniref:hypothetical protein n=1 Tax=Lysinibacillus sp. KU-BSD001 TaxID=3141328 RepID=UPI0036E5E509
MKNEQQKHSFLCEALEDIKTFQDVLTTSWSKYYGHLLMKIVGSDTIPFCLITTEGTILSLSNATAQIETTYFRLEEIEKQSRHITVSLLRAFDLEDNETNMMKDVVRLEKSTAKATVDLRYITAIQLLDPDLLVRKFYVESKW